MLTNLPKLWKTRLAVINEFQLSNAAAIELFQVSDRELLLARGLVEQGTWVIPSLTIDERSQYTALIPSSALQTASAIVSTIAISTTATEQRVTQRKVKPPKPQSTVLADVFNHIPVTPIPLQQFIKQHGISKAILRQSKRFTTVPIRVSIKRDPKTNIEMLCKVE